MLFEVYNQKPMYICLCFATFIILPLFHWWGQAMAAQEPLFRLSSKAGELRLDSTWLSPGASRKMSLPWWEPPSPPILAPSY